MINRKIVLITGASRGIGASIAKQLAMDGFDIWLNYKSNDEEAKKVAIQVESYGAKCKLLKFDVSKFDDVKSILEPIMQNNKIFAFISNAGSFAGGKFADVLPTQYKEIFDVIVGGFFNIAKFVVPNMVNNKEGRIISMSSLAAFSGRAGQVHYGAAKAALAGATVNLAAELAKDGILVNAIAPAMIYTDEFKNVSKEQLAAHIPVGYAGDVEDVSSMVSYLCLPKSKFITGQVFHINGGLYNG